MQDELNTKTVVLAINTGKRGVQLTEKMLKAALRKYLEHRKVVKTERRHERLQERNERARARDRPEGKQTLRQLMNHNMQLSDVEISGKNIKSFEKVAKKYDIDFALKQDWSSGQSRYLVFFKSKDARVMDRAFKEYSKKIVPKKEKPSIRKKLEMFRKKMPHRSRQRERQRTKGRER